MKVIDLTGRVFGRLEIIKRGNPKSNYRGGAMWTCVCSCGIERDFSSACLLHDDTKSCGCIKREQTIALNKSRSLIPSMNIKDKRAYLYLLNRIKWSYGLSEESYRDMVDKTKGCCPICGKGLTDGRYGMSLAIDHDHTTGKVRGIICNTCNKGLGHFFDNISSLTNAIKYLKEDLQ